MGKPALFLSIKKSTRKNGDYINALKHLETKHIILDQNEHTKTLLLFLY